MSYPAKLSIILQENKWSFSDIEDFAAFMLKRPELYRKFDFQTQKSGEASKDKQERKVIKKLSKSEVFIFLLGRKLFVTLETILSVWVGGRIVYTCTHAHTHTH